MLVDSGFRGAWTKGFQARTYFSKPGISPVFLITSQLARPENVGLQCKIHAANYFLAATWNAPSYMLVFYFKNARLSDHPEFFLALI